MVGGQTSLQHEEEQSPERAAWNPVSGAIAGADSERDLFSRMIHHDSQERVSDDNVSPNASRPHTPNAGELEEERKDNGQSSSESDSRSEDRIDKLEPSSSTDRSGTDSSKEKSDSGFQAILWSPGTLPVPDRQRQRLQSRHSILGPDDEDEDDGLHVDEDGRRWWWRKSVFKMRPYDDDEPSDWWFASTAAPLLAATSAPLANVLSIAALVTPWRMNVNDGSGGIVPDFEGQLFHDPRWCYYLNLLSLLLGFLGNIFLLFNFTGRIRYILALPVTIFLWYAATFVLVAITVSMHIYTPPVGPYEIYSQGFWYAVIAAVLYFFSCTVLHINMWGYFLGHYPQRFELNDHQRTLILQTMLFFVWLAAGGGIFSAIESVGTKNPNWTFVDGLYFCDVTILTVGFGDLTPHNDLGRGLVFPYSVIGIVMLGLVISSISKFAQEIASDNVVRKHADKQRTRTLQRSTTDPMELERHEILRNFRGAHINNISAPFNGRRIGRKTDQGRRSGERRGTVVDSGVSQRSRRSSVIPAVQKRLTVGERLKLRHHKIKLLSEEKDRFNEMRRIQKDTERFKRYWSLTLSAMAFILLWAVGAAVFWRTEKAVQGMTYFQALYFCYVSLLTIGYGDFAPQSNPGRSFFVVWSLIAVPTMTLLISDMSSTVIDSFKRLTTVIADYSVLLKKDAFAGFMNDHPRVKKWYQEWKQKRAANKRLRRGMPVGADTDSPLGGLGLKVTNADEEANLERITSQNSKFNTNGHGQESKTTGEDTEGLKRVESEKAKVSAISGNKYTPDDGLRIHHGSTPGASALLPNPTLKHLVKQVERDEKNQGINEAALARRLATAIRAVAGDLKEVGEHEVRYTFEQWAELTRLIRFTAEPADQALEEEANDVLEWDWLGEDSPMMTHLSEPEFVLDRLCESLVRYTRRVERRVEGAYKKGQKRRESVMLMVPSDDNDRIMRGKDTENEDKYS
jgi:potassium channel subfamily K